MKVTLEFNLPDESEEHRLAMEGSKYHTMIWDILQYVRTLRKYDERSKVPKDEIIDKIHELTSEFDY